MDKYNVIFEVKIMSKIKEKKHDKLKFSLAIVSIIIVLALLASLLFSLFNQIKNENYSERKSYLSDIANNSATVLNEAIESKVETVNMLIALTMDYLPKHGNVKSFLEMIGTRFSEGETILFLIDNNGNYFSSKNTTGRVVHSRYFTASSDNRIMYISDSMGFGTESYLYIREKLSEPIIDINGQEIYFAVIAFPLSSMMSKITEGSGYNCNTLIIQREDGYAPYIDYSIGVVFEGSNAFYKLKSGKMIHKEDHNELIERIRNGKTIAAEFKAPSGNYFTCIAPLKYNNWSICFVISSDSLSEKAANLSSNITAHLIFIALLFSIEILMVILLILKNNDSEKMLRKETEAKEMMHKASIMAEEASKAKTEFLSHMSHDIRTPINGIMGMTTIAKKVENNPEKTKECLEKIDGASQHLLSLVNDVLDMSRIESGRVTISSEPVNLLGIFDNCASIVKGQLTGRNLNFVTQFNLPNANVFGDELHLRQIIINILGNAIKFTPDGGTITFKADEIASDGEEAKVRMIFSDTGIGMKASFLEQIWEPFSQEDGGSRTTYKGTGLEMAITKRFVDLMGGNISVESVEGKGSVFTVDISFLINSIDAKPEAEKEVSADSLDGISILLVEDNELNLEIAVEIFEDAGAKVETAENGKIALEKFIASEKGKYDVILMDVMMPVMNGLDATKAIRAVERTDAVEIPIIAMTANAFENDIKQCRDAGMDAHLSKPINVATSIKTIANFIKK